MADDSMAIDELVARYRGYLLVLAQAQVEPDLHARLDLEGVVQQTLLEAWQSSPDRAGWATWLRRLLAHNLADELRKLRAEKRDIDRERSLEANLTATSLRLGEMLAARQSTPSARLTREEKALQVAAALESLPKAQREALILQHWHGWTLAQIAGHLHRTPAAVAGLLKRGLRQLREILDK